MRHRKLAAWTHDDGQTTFVHDAVIEAAARAKLNEDGLFPVGVFLELVRQIEKER